MTTFLVLDDEEVEIMTFGLNDSLKHHRRERAGIMRVRMEKAADGESNPGGWKETRFNNLILRVSRREKIVRRLDNAPNTADPAQSD